MARSTLLGLSAVLWLLFACGPGGRPDTSGDDHGDGGSDACPRSCAADGSAVVDCHGDIVSSCDSFQGCDSTTVSCSDACQAAENNQSSIGCDYYATAMQSYMANVCVAAFVANTWSSPVKIAVEYNGVEQPIASFARIPVGNGPSLTYAPYNPSTGLMPGEVAILFLAGNTGAAPFCPITPAVPDAGKLGTLVADSFHIRTNVPVVAYQINPFGGGSSAFTGASLLIPTSAWAEEYVAVTAAPGSLEHQPSFNIVARDDGTIATLMPVAPVEGGTGIGAAAANVPLQISLNKGQHAQLTQAADLSGSIVTSNKPIGFMAGHPCMNIPTSVRYCDHAEQMIPPVRALGHRHVGVMYRKRIISEMSTFWRVVGTVDGTQLTYSSPVGGPTTLARGQSAMFETGEPFVVESQDKDHPFMLFAYMSSSLRVAEGYGDPDFVLSVPPEQYLNQYVFFADPTYPETNLVIVRSRASGSFHDVTLDCAGTISGWQPVGNDFEYARVDLVTGDFQNVGGCSTGRRFIKSDAPFGLWVWGWGTPRTTAFTQNVSYGYPGGMNVTPINDVILGPPVHH